MAEKTTILKIISIYAHKKVLKKIYKKFIKNFHKWLDIFLQKKVYY